MFWPVQTKELDDEDNEEFDHSDLCESMESHDSHDENGKDYFKTNMFRHRPTKVATQRRMKHTKTKDLQTDNGKVDHSHNKYFNAKEVKDDNETAKESVNIMSLLKTNIKSTNVLFSNKNETNQKAKSLFGSLATLRKQDAANSGGQIDQGGITQVLGLLQEMKSENE